MSDTIKIIARVSGYKNLRIEGGFRIMFDIFESREKDIALCALLANRKETVEIIIKKAKEAKDD